MAHPKVKISDNSGNTVAVDTSGASNALKVALVAGTSIDIGDVDIHLSGNVPLLGNAGAVAAGVLRVTLASDDPAVASLDEIEGAVETIEQAIASDAAASPAKCISIGGNTSGGNIQEIRVNTNGELMVDLATASTGASGATVPFKIDSVAYNTGDVGIMAKVVCSDTLATLTNVTNGEISSLQVDTQGAVYTTHGITGMVSGNNANISDTTAEILRALGNVACKRVDMMSPIANTGVIYVGASNVSATNGIALNPGDFYSVDVNGTSDIYVLAEVDGEDIYFTYFT